MSFLLMLVLAVLVLCVVYWAVTSLLTAFKVEDPIRTIIVVAVVLVLLIWFIGYTGVLGGTAAHWRLT
jgi:hypothetical protein